MKEVLSLPSTVRLRVTQFDKIARTAGLDTLTAQAAHVGLTEGGLSRVKNGRTGPNGHSIGAILSAFRQWTFEDLFEVVPTGEADE